MYKLTLTKTERKAFDWVGYRYNAGEISDLLIQCSALSWSETDEDIYFEIPEHVAWRIRDLAEEENNMWPCFSGTLALKLNRFISSIV